MLPEHLKKFAEPIKVLDDGHIMLVDVMGDEQAIVDAARVSYGAGTKRVSEDKHLIRYLMRHSHTTPFEMCEIKIRIRVPMDAWRQYIRHRTASVNEYSTRYSEAIDSMAKTDPSEWRLQATDNKQGSAGFFSLEHGTVLSLQEEEFQQLATNLYKSRLAAGMAREQARKDLPLSTYTEAYWKIDLHNLLHFLRLRTDSHAQKEIRDYAVVLENIVREWVPNVWQAFVDYTKESVKFSRMELAILKKALASCNVENYDMSELSKREVNEFKQKIHKIRGL